MIRSIKLLNYPQLVSCLQRQGICQNEGVSNFRQKHLLPVIVIRSSVFLFFLLNIDYYVASNRECYAIKQALDPRRRKRKREKKRSRKSCLSRAARPTATQDRVTAKDDFKKGAFLF